MRHALARILLVTALGTAGLALPGCRPAQEAPPAPPPAAVTVVRPVRYPVQRYYEYNGYLEAVESVRIMARVKGFLNEIRFTEGEEVRKDDLLFKIDPREYQVAVKKGEADRLKAVVELNRARREERRAAELVGGRAMSAEEYQQRVATREAAEAAVQQAEAAVEAAKLELSFTEIRAPIAGQINRTLHTRGNLVGPGDAAMLTTIVSVDPLYVYFDVPERDLVAFQRSRRERPLPGPTSRLYPVEVGVETEGGFPHRGQIDYRENRVDTATGTVRIRGRIPNPMMPPGNARLLYPGLYAHVRVPDGEPQPRLAVPEDALMTGQEGRYVYVLGPGDVVEKRTVTVGPYVWKAAPPAGGTPPPWTMRPAHPAPGQDAAAVPVQAVVAVEAGLQPGDRVVVNGLTQARPGAPVAPQEWAVHAPPAPK